MTLVDIGGGTTDLATFYDHSIQHTSVIPVGGDHITKDLAVGLRTPMREAERIKRRYGCAKAGHVDRNETIESAQHGWDASPASCPAAFFARSSSRAWEELFRMVPAGDSKERT